MDVNCLFDREGLNAINAAHVETFTFLRGVDDELEERWSIRARLSSGTTYVLKGEYPTLQAAQDALITRLL